MTNGAGADSGYQTSPQIEELTAQDASGLPPGIPSPPKDPPPIEASADEPWQVTTPAAPPDDEWGNFTSSSSKKKKRGKKVAPVEFGFDYKA